MFALSSTFHSLIPKFFVVMLGLLSVAGASTAAQIDISPDQPKRQLDAAMEFWPSLGPVPGPAYAAYKAGKFSPRRETARHGFGHAPEMWFALELTNRSFDDGREGDPFVFVFDAPSIVGYRLFLVRADGLTENLVDYSLFRAFDARQHAVNRLQSPEVMLAPGETVTVLAHLQLGLMPVFSLTVDRPETLTADSLLWASTNTAFYAFALSCLLIGVGFQFAMKSLIGSLYLAVLALFLGGLALSDLLVFRFVLPDNPGLHRAAIYGVFFAISAAMSLLVSLSLRQPPVPRPRIAKILLGLAGLSGLGLLSTLFFESELQIYASIAISTFALAANIFADHSHWRREDNPNAGMRVLFTIIFVLAAALIGWGLFGWNSHWISVRTGLKLIYGLMLLAVMGFLTYNLIVLRLRHLSAVKSRMQALESEAERSRQLLKTERAYIQARETSEARQRQLATASHDIKQPLMSLRTTFDTIASDMDSAVRTRLAEAFLYLENLSKSYVDGTVPAKEAPEAEAYALAVPLRTIEQMFAAEAAAKGLRLNCVEPSAETTAPPLPLMRILTNLVSNAIKYSSHGGVVVGLRRAGPTLWVCDTGAGMSAEEIEAFKTAYHKGANSGGHGLGLSVCTELAAANNMPLTVSSVVGRGTVFRLSLANYCPDSPRQLPE